VSDCRWCNRCNSPFSTDDPDARKFGVEEPVMQDNIKRGTVTIERDACGRCMRAERRAAEESRLALEAQERGDAPTVVHAEHQH